LAKSQPLGVECNRGLSGSLVPIAKAAEHRRAYCKMIREIRQRCELCRLPLPRTTWLRL
jgi:hypothetical protein